MSFHQASFDQTEGLSGYCHPPVARPVENRVQSEIQQDPLSYGHPPTARPAFLDGNSGGNYDEPPDAVPVEFCPVTQQPLPKPQDAKAGERKGSKNTPLGLEYLTNVDHLFVKQSVEVLEAMCGCEGKNNYKILNKDKQIIYTAEENTNCCSRNCLGHRRPFDLVIKDHQERAVIHLSRPLACDTCFCPCFLQSIEVSSAQDTPMGSVEQDWSLCIPQFSVKDPSGDTILHIQGPICTSSCCGSVEFKILCKNAENELGKISKEWSGVVQEGLTDADTFGISFPKTLDVRTKAVLIGACLLIDFMFFEE